MANYRQEARRAAKRHGLNPDLFERQIGAESGFNPGAVSPAGARGIAQFMPSTARGLGVNPDNPSQALDGAAKLMSGYVQKYGSYKNALVAYNAGPGRVGKPLFSETANYIDKILQGSNQTQLSGRVASQSPGRNQDSQGSTVTLGGGTKTVDDPEAQRRVVLANFLAQRNPNSLLLRLGILDPNESTTRTVTQPTIKINTGSLGSNNSIRGGSGGSSFGSRGRGSVKITGPNPNRIVPGVRNFMGEISSVLGGETITGSDGTGHSYYTVNGNVSEHSTGHASDIPAAGDRLIKLGRAALIAAGWSPKKANSVRGGLFNVFKNGRRYQIIFNTQEGGDHTDHLHVGVK